MPKKEYKLNENYVNTAHTQMNNILFDVNNHSFAAVKKKNGARTGWKLFRFVGENGKIPVTNEMYDDIETIRVERGTRGKLNRFSRLNQEFIVCRNPLDDTIYSVDLHTGKPIRLNNKKGMVFPDIGTKFSSTFDFIFAGGGLNILTPEGFMFDDGIDALGLKNVENWQLFEKAGLIPVRKDEKLNVFEDRTLTPVLDEFAEKIVISKNKFNTMRDLLLLVKYREGVCDILEVADLKPIFDKSIENIYTNDEGFVFFKFKGRMHLFVSPDRYIKCNNCTKCYYGELLFLDDGYMFYFEGRLSDKFDEVYDVDSLFPTVMKDGKYNFLERTTGHPVFDEWFDDVEPFDEGDEITYNGNTHKFTVYENGEKKTLTYSPKPNFSIA